MDSLLNKLEDPDVRAALARALPQLAQDNPDVAQLLDEVADGVPDGPPRIPTRVEVELCPEHLCRVQGRPDRWFCPADGGHELSRLPVTQAYALPVVYPRMDGPHVVLGPEVFASADKGVICWRGDNYVRQDNLRFHLAAVLSAAGLMIDGGEANGAA